MAKRPVDIAMDEERAEKATIRGLWVEKVNYHSNLEHQQEDRIYLSLVGKEGRDIDALVKGGVIGLTEANSLTPESAKKIVAVERDKAAVLHLQRQFPGLKIYEQSIENLLRGESLIRFPEGDDSHLCRASVINLDLNQSLSAQIVDGDAKFPLMVLVRKFALMHCQAPKRNWTLLLTLHGELNWPNEVWTHAASYLAENFQNTAEFSDEAQRILGDVCYKSVVNGKAVSLARDKQAHQRLLLTLVPKLIADTVRDQGWDIAVDWSFSYGRPNSERAPMVTWAIDFTAGMRPMTALARYRSNLTSSLRTVRKIDSDGEILPHDE